MDVFATGAILRSIRTYVDTSVFGGTQELEFHVASQAFFDRVRRGDFVVLTSELVTFELEYAPASVRAVIEGLAPEMLEYVSITAEVEALADAYIRAGALGHASRQDAVHVAAATVYRADLIVSWNFKHIVNYSRIKKFNGANAIEGYGTIDIRSPLEVVHDVKS